MSQFNMLEQPDRKAKSFGPVSWDILKSPLEKDPDKRLTSPRCRFHPYVTMIYVAEPSRKSHRLGQRYVAKPSLKHDPDKGAIVFVPGLAICRSQEEEPYHLHDRFHDMSKCPFLSMALAKEYCVPGLEICLCSALCAGPIPERRVMSSDWWTQWYVTRMSVGMVQARM